MVLVFFLVYGSALLFIFGYSMAQAHLVYRYLRGRTKRIAAQQRLPALADYPPVTVQLPVYNERYVIERLLDSVAALDYPADKLQIQVLDDSTDETVALIARKVAQLRAGGINITQIRRSVRTGYKAGALQDALPAATGEFIAIFDADFVPPADFLKQTLPYFANPAVGMVQTRWQHLNKWYSILTRLQAFALDAHFTVEQVGRNAGNYFINFNGTGGIWRKSCIADAGGWSADTLTEDLDLSYRAQLKGWQFQYLEHIGSPAELPPIMSALKSQQYRWNKGGAENARKHLAQVFASDVSLGKKLHGAFHLLNSCMFLCVVICALLSVPAMFIMHYFPEYAPLYRASSFLLLSLLVIGVLYWVSIRAEFAGTAQALRHFLRTFPLFLSMSMGLSLHNAIAVAEGLLGRKTPFIRTPKFNTNEKRGWARNPYRTSSITPATFLEGLLALYALFGIGVAFWFNTFGLLPFHLMLTFGFGAVFYYSVFHSAPGKTPAA